MQCGLEISLLKAVKNVYIIIYRLFIIIMERPFNHPCKNQTVRYTLSWELELN